MPTDSLGRPISNIKVIVTQAHRTEGTLEPVTVTLGTNMAKLDHMLKAIPIVAILMAQDLLKESSDMFHKAVASLTGISHETLDDLFNDLSFKEVKADNIPDWSGLIVEYHHEDGETSKHQFEYADGSMKPYLKLGKAMKWTDDKFNYET